uniref:Putative glutathione S-transferase n=1 Tax=Toxoplasma gondii COUG TaxID=1074873 RepID=A0A2G8XZT3_TOXGO|nr:putative glutathione S-transferase [Toxoplasma gondii COUG]
MTDKRNPRRLACLPGRGRRHRCAQVARVDHFGLRWLLDFAVTSPFFRGVRLDADAVAALATVCQHQLEDALGSPSTIPSRKVTFPVPVDDLQPNVELHHRLARVVARFYTGVTIGPPRSLKKDILVYLKCRGSVDAIRLILNDQSIPYMEFHVGRSITSDTFKDEFVAARLPDSLPYYSDGTCEMTGAGTVLRYVSAKTGLMGRSPEERIKIDSIIEYGFSVLQSLWRAECQCGETQRIGQDRAKAKFVKEKLLPILRTLDALVPANGLAATSSAADCQQGELSAFEPRRLQPTWVQDFFSVADIVIYSCASSVVREFGQSILLPFVNIVRHSEAVEGYRPNIKAFSESPHRY